jgi:hypothetical protein
MTFIRRLIIFLLLISQSLFPQNSAEENLKFEFLPAGLNFMPLKANHQEARLGVLYYTATSNLKVDIGNTIDLFSFEFAEDDIRITLGIDFMAYAFSTSFEGRRLQIDAIDGFFGGNLSFSKRFQKNNLLGRFRIIHNSAHFVDGHYDLDQKNWLNDTEPIPFTRDFGELTIAHEIIYTSTIIKYYGGLSYSSLVRPSELKRFNYHAGIEAAFVNLFGEIFNHNTNIFLAHHFLLAGAERYTGSQQIQAGIKFGNWHSKGIVFYLSYYTGSDVFSSYYYRHIKKWGIGFNVDF